VGEEVKGGQHQHICLSAHMAFVVGVHASANVCFCVCEQQHQKQQQQWWW
jgi:hypothetical protein